MPAEVLKLTQEFLKAPKYVQVGRRGGPAQTISHNARTMPKGEKVEWLAKWLRHEAEGPVLVFCRTKIGVDRLASRLCAMGIRAAALHADRSQQQRMSAVEGFRTGTYPVLVATDVAARGLDIDGIAHVVNFEVPDTPEAYVHRVGRTGRAESTGNALTLVAPGRSARPPGAGESRWRSTSITRHPRCQAIRSRRRRRVPSRPLPRPPPPTYRSRARSSASARAGGCNRPKTATRSSARTGK
jgi:ATP-dependent RNA helicase RhlE